MSNSLAYVRTTLRKAGCEATPPFSASPCTSTRVLAVASPSRNSAPVRAGIRALLTRFLASAVLPRPHQAFPERNPSPAARTTNLPTEESDGCLSTVNESLAGRVSYLLEPKNWIIATTLAVGWRADGARGLAWGAVAAIFAGVLPMVFISRGVRAGRWDDRYVGGKRARLIVLLFIVASVTAGLALLVGFGAPAELSGYLACMLGSVAVLAAITTVWKISIHCAVAAGSVTILALLD